MRAVFIERGLMEVEKETSGSSESTLLSQHIEYGVRSISALKFPTREQIECNGQGLGSARESSSNSKDPTWERERLPPHMEIQSPSLRPEKQKLWIHVRLGYHVGFVT